jgi:hypothetical protein
MQLFTCAVGYSLGRQIYTETHFECLKSKDLEMEAAGFVPHNIKISLESSV